MKTKKRNTPLFKVFGLLILCFIILIKINQNRTIEISQHGIQNEGVIDFFRYESFIDNAKSQNRISYYNIGFQYYYLGQKYSVIQEMQITDFKEKIGRKLKKGDKILIRHSKRSPKKVEIIKQ